VQLAENEVALEKTRWSAIEPYRHLLAGGNPSRTVSTQVQRWEVVSLSHRELELVVVRWDATLVALVMNQTVMV
jgi:hypothetical protein